MLFKRNKAGIIKLQLTYIELKGKGVKENHEKIS